MRKQQNVGDRRLGDCEMFFFSYRGLREKTWQSAALWVLYQLQIHFKDSIQFIYCEGCMQSNAFHTHNVTNLFPHLAHSKLKKTALSNESDKSQFQLRFVVFHRLLMLLDL